MTTISLLRQRLADCWLILAMLLAVTLMADFVADRLGINVLLGDANRLPFETTRAIDWLQTVTLVSALICGLLNRDSLLQRLASITIGLVTFGLVIRVLALVVTFSLQPHLTGFTLLLDGLMLWIMTVLVFGSWYWLIDTGGFSEGVASNHTRRDLLFPQQSGSLPERQDWQPEPVDYLYVAFNTSTAFSPTDTLFLTRRAKILMMCHAGTALVIVTIILSRAINIIQ